MLKILHHLLIQELIKISFEKESYDVLSTFYKKHPYSLITIDKYISNMLNKKIRKK